MKGDGTASCILSSQFPFACFLFSVLRPMQPNRAVLLAALLSLAACQTASPIAPPSGPASTPTPVLTVRQFELTVDRPQAAPDGVELELCVAGRLRRPTGEHLELFTLVVSKGTERREVPGDHEAFFEEARAFGWLVTVSGWTPAGALRVGVEPAPSRPPLEEDVAGELAEAEAAGRGYDVLAAETSYELTRGEGALVYVLSQDERVLCRVYVGLHSGTVLAVQPGS